MLDASTRDRFPRSVPAIMTSPPPQSNKTHKAGLVCKEPQFGASSNFPNKLFQMLEHAHEKGYEATVSWSADGKSFQLDNPEDFMEHLLPKFFPNQSSLRSFERMLNVWGFVRIRDGSPSKSNQSKKFSHPHFIRDKRFLIKRIQRASHGRKAVRVRKGIVTINQQIPHWAQEQQKAALQFLRKQTGEPEAHLEAPHKIPSSTMPPAPFLHFQTSLTHTTLQSSTPELPPPGFYGRWRFQRKKWLLLQPKPGWLDSQIPPEGPEDTLGSLLQKSRGQLSFRSPYIHGQFDDALSDQNATERRGRAIFEWSDIDLVF